jgi:FkbM family methyltransferase
MNKNNIKYLTTIKNLNLLNHENISLNNEYDIEKYLLEFNHEDLIVVITKSKNLISKIKNKKNIIPIEINSSKKFIEIGDSGGWLIVPNENYLDKIFTKYFKEILSLWKINFNKTTNELIFFKNQILKKIKQNRGVYIFGAGTIGKQVLQECQNNNINVLGFVDNYGIEINNYKVSKLNEISNKDNIIVIAVGKSAEAIRSQLELNCFNNVINLSQFFYIINSKNEPEVNYLQDLQLNKFEWLRFGLNLNDNNSLLVLSAILKHRLSLNTKYLAEVHDKKNIQWFDEQLIDKNKDAVFVDCGAYDGDTAEAFYNFNSGAKKIYAFEIDADIAIRAQKRLSRFQCAEVYSQGVADTKRQLNFSKTGITHGRLDSFESNSVKVNVISIDEKIKEKITYLKLDIEGAEELAIKGSERHISETNPVLGIAAYHKAEDIWNLQLKIQKLNQNYKFYIRHYTDVSFETVLYCIPTYYK